MQNIDDFLLSPSPEDKPCTHTLEDSYSTSIVRDNGEFSSSY